ncbi:hypothetical protein KY285_036676 [Solanum tuberosum]|nr:hypothetical protein KY285_036676 [Solanum tuberosum]
MGKNQTIIKDTQSQGQGVCEKSFKSLHLTSIFRYFSRNPKSKIATSDHHHRSDPAKATELKLVVTQKDQIASNKVHVEYNHREVIESKTGSHVHMLATRDHIENQDYTNYNDTSSNDRFSRYIDHVKSKIMSSYDDDEHDIDPSKFEIRTTDQIH